MTVSELQEIFARSGAIGEYKDALAGLIADWRQMREFMEAAHVLRGQCVTLALARDIQVTLEALKLKP